LISIAVMLATSGAGITGTGLVNSTFGAGTVSNAALQSALNAGFTTLSQQAAVTLINNKGDLGKTLKQLGSSDSLKSLATSMITAGLSSKLGSTFNLTGDKLTLAQQFQQKALNGLVSATVSTAIEGGNFDDKLKAVLKTATLDTLNQLGAQKVGDLLGSGQYGYLAHKIAHTALGCAVGAATNDDCESAAIGGLVGSIAGDHYNSEQAATLTAAIAATLLGKDVNLAANVGTIADKFNRQLHQSEVDWVKEKAKKLAKEKGISEAEALKLLMLEAVQLADYTYEQVLPDNPEIRSWLETQATQDGQFQKQSNLIGLETTVDGYFDSSINRDVVSQNAGLYLATIGLSPERAATINRQNVMGEWGEGYDDAKAQALLDRYQTVAEFMLPDIMLIPEAYEAYQNGEYGKALLLAGMITADAYTPGKLPFPHGFNKVEDFLKFGEDLNAGLKNTGIHDAESIFQGSAVTGKKYTTGEPFDAGRVSDFDIAISSPSLMEKARDAGISLRSQGSRTGPLKPSELKALGIYDLQKQLSEQAGRPVNFMIYSTTDAATSRAPSIMVPK
jgi:filamentous hemagglutinin